MTLIRNPARHFSRRPIIPMIIGLSILLISAILWMATHPNWMKPYINRIESRKLGRKFQIGGNLAIDWSLTPRIDMKDVTLANAPWAKPLPMLQIEEVIFHLDLPALIRGQTILPKIQLTNPHLLLEKNTKDQGNWVMGNGKGASVKIGKIIIHGGHLEYRSSFDGTDVLASVDTGQTAGTPSILIHATGQLHHEPLNLNGKGGTLLTLRNQNTPYPMNFSGHVGPNQIHASGTLTDPLHLRGLNVVLTLSGQDLAGLYPILGLPFPTTSAYHLTGSLVHRPHYWALNNFSGQVGKSDLEGSLSVTLHSPRNFLKADLTSRHLVFKDLAGFIGGSKKGAQNTPRIHAHNGHILPNTPYNPDKLNAMDANIRFSGEQVISPSLPIENLVAHAQIRKGILTLNPLNFGIAHGTLATQLTLNAQNRTMQTKVRVHIEHLQLKPLLGHSRFAQTSAGSLNGSGLLDMKGNSIASMLAHANGRVMADMAGGKISALLIKLSGIDLSGSLPYLFKDKNEKIRCAVAAGGIHDGLMQVHELLLSTSDSDIAGTGQIDFGKEHLHLAMLGQPHHFSLIRPRTPFEITGSFEHPRIQVKKFPLILRAGAAVTLGVLFAPAGALLATIGVGNRSEANCPALLNQANNYVSR